MAVGRKLGRSKHFKYVPMACDKNSMSPNDRFLAQQEHRQISRLWRKAIDKMSASNDDAEFDSDNIMTATLEVCDESNARKFPSEAVQKKLAKGKSIAKLKSPLQKFDEVVTKELTRRMSEGCQMPAFETPCNWSGVQFNDFGRGKIGLPPENKVSRGAVHGVEKEYANKDPSDASNAALMDAIEKLAQAQAYCRFDAAVKAAEAATATVPPEMAEEVAVACAKDYQSEIVDVINQKISLTEEKKPVEVIGYIGITKLKESA